MTKEEELWIRLTEEDHETIRSLIIQQVDKLIKKVNRRKRDLTLLTSDFSRLLDDFLPEMKEKLNSVIPTVDDIAVAYRDKEVHVSKFAAFLSEFLKARLRRVNNLIEFHQELMEYINEPIF